MNKLFCSNLVRLKKNKAFWLGMAVIIAYGIIVCLSSYQVMEKYSNDPDVSGFTFDVDTILFSTLAIVGIALSVIISLFIGTDYSDGTIRNKIIIGQSRRNIYCSNFLTCTMISVIIYLLGVGVTTLLGVPLLGEIQMEASYIFKLFLDGLLMVTAYAAIFNFVAMLNSNKAHGAIISVLLAFGMMFVAIYLSQALTQPEMIEELKTVGDQMTTQMVKNPRYLTGIKREVFQFFLDFIPNGQGIQIANLEVLHPYRMAGYSVILIVVFNLLGGILFYKRNIK